MSSQNDKLDAAEGFTLSHRLFASNGAADIALLGQQADIVITDWFWVMRQRSLGGDYLFMPFTAALGGVIVPEGSPIKSVLRSQGEGDRRRRRPYRQELDLVARLRHQARRGRPRFHRKPVFGAPPLLNEQAAAGPGGRALELLALRGKARSQGLAAADRRFGHHALFRHRRGVLPLVGFVFAAKPCQRRAQALMQGFARAVLKAQRILLDSDEEWERIRPLMKASSDEEFRLLRDRYREGVHASWNEADREDARKLFEIVRETGGEDVTGAGVQFDPKAFWDGFVL